MKIKVAIAEDNNRLYQTIKDKLSLFSEEVEFLFRSKNGKELVEALKGNTFVDVILMDIEMPILNGIDATSIVTELYPNIKIIMLTVFDDDDKIFHSVQAGAMGYLLKEESAKTILNSIKEIINGGAPMSPSIAAKSLNLLKKPVSTQNETPFDFGLTKREIDVLEKISDGLSYIEVAESLFISPSTVRKHNENIYKKLQVNNKIKAIKIATKFHLI